MPITLKSQSIGDLKLTIVFVVCEQKLTGDVRTRTLESHGGREGDLNSRRENAQLNAQQDDITV